MMSWPKKNEHYFPADGSFFASFFQPAAAVAVHAAVLGCMRVHRDARESVSIFAKEDAEVGGMHGRGHLEEDQMAMISLCLVVESFSWVLEENTTSILKNLDTIIKYY